MSSLSLRKLLSPENGATAVCDADHQNASRLCHAVDALRIARPKMSAAGPLAGWQRAALLCAAPVVLAFVVFAWAGQAGSVAVGFTLPFSLIILLRIASIWNCSTPRSGNLPKPPELADQDLPHFSVLVPLFREGAVVPALVDALRGLDYPPGKLDVLFVTEQSDNVTRDALTEASLPLYMRIIEVPAGLPQTKPRALNFALPLAIGELIAVYDAEDLPHPRQLRCAASRFAISPPDLVCLQARLRIHNADHTFLTRQFALEYAALFEAVMPLLERIGLPILLGGTSNHFRRSALDEIAGWDPFNVTEDADLGVRLARFGKRAAMLDSDTWEEAPATLPAWTGQRTRWLKGWMQTYLVHMREPRQLWRDLGGWRFLGVQVTLGGMIFSALVHPWFYIAAACQLILRQTVLPSGNLWVLCWFNLWAGYAAGITLGLIAAWRSQGRVPIVSAFLVPFYWLAISWASYRALFEFYHRPFHWEKTQHSARSVTAVPLST